VLLPRIATITLGSSNDEKHALAETLLRRLPPSDDVHAVLPYLAPLFGLDKLTIPPNVDPEEVNEQTISALVRIFEVDLSLSDRWRFYGRICTGLTVQLSNSSRGCVGRSGESVRWSL
jgi:hypothetical protein